MTGCRYDAGLGQAAFGPGVRGAQVGGWGTGAPPFVDRHVAEFGRQLIDLLKNRRGIIPAGTDQPRPSESPEILDVYQIL